MESRQRGKSQREQAQQDESVSGSKRRGRLPGFGFRKALAGAHHAANNERVESELQNKHEPDSETAIVASGRIDLQWINKLVFVQEFDRAYAELMQICLSSLDHVEAWFRIVEIAVRTGRDGILLEQIRLLLEPQGLAVGGTSVSSAAHIAAVPRAVLLAKFLLLIRIAERNQRDESDEHFINPTLNSGTRQSSVQDVFALGQSDSEQGLSLPRSYLGLASLEAGRRGYLLGKSIRLARSPLVADDLAPQDPQEVEIEKFAQENGNRGQNSVSAGIDDAIIAISEEIKQMLLDHKDDYAVWYVYGCVSELLGNLTQAMDSWNRAYDLSPRSLCVLSTLSELQQIGALPVSEQVDYSSEFEGLDRFAVHGSYETHFLLYEEFLQLGEFRLAIAALRTLADWMQRQRGEVPIEIEIVCLFGAMKAHRLEGNSGAAESCRREAENLTVSFKKSGENIEALAFVAARADEFDLPSLARMCYFSILTSLHGTKETILKIAAHCVSRFSSRALAECLRVAYRNHKGDPEMRFCQLLCTLAIDDVPVKNYLERKNAIRRLLADEDVGAALSLLQEANQETSEDPEVQYYLAEIYARMGSPELALKHYDKMYSLDDLNAESVIRFLQFQLKNKAYAAVDSMSRRLFESGILTLAQEGEVHWALAAASFARERVEDARHSVAHALRCAPWNMTFIALALRLHNPALQLVQTSVEEVNEIESLLSAFEDMVLAEGTALSSDLKQKWIRKGKEFIGSGHLEFAFLMACGVFNDLSADEDVARFFCLAAGAYDSRLAAARLMLLLNGKKEGLSLAFIGTCIARIYSFANEWSLVGEWIDIAFKSSLDDSSLRLQLFELEALKHLFEGNQTGRAKALIEAVLDGYQDRKKVPKDIEILHGYLIVLNGDIKNGIEKMRNNLQEEASVFGLYCYLKALDRVGGFPDARSQELKAFFNKIPLNRLEQKLIEEIHMILGINQVDAIVRLPC